jgi:hypothetical protein
MESYISPYVPSGEEKWTRYTEMQERLPQASAHRGHETIDVDN